MAISIPAAFPIASSSTSAHPWLWLSSQQAVEDSSQMHPQPSSKAVSLNAEYSASLVQATFQPPDPIGGLLTYVNVFLILGNPKLDVTPDAISRCWTEGEIPSLGSLGTLLWAQSGGIGPFARWAHCQLTFCLPPRTPSSHCAKVLSSQQCPACIA